MDDTEIIIASDNLLMKVFAITGWSMPDDDILADELSRQLSLKLKECYPNYNHLEIEFAFRNYGGTVKDWGKNFNLSLLDEVMAPYVSHRLEVSQQEERLNTPKMTLNNSITTEAEMLQDIEDFENRKGVTIDSIPPYIYDYLLKVGKLPTENSKKWAALESAADYRKTELYNESLKLRTDDVNRYQAFLKMYAENDYKGDEVGRLKILAKKIMVMNYLEQINF